MKHRRRKSLNIPGHAHELTFSCYKRFPFLKAERTCRWLIEAIDAARTELDFAVWAYVFMPEHVHLIVYPRQPVYEMADIRAAIKEPVGRKAIAYMEKRAPRWLEQVTRRRGQRRERLFWQSGGGYDRNVDNPRTLWSMIDYTHANPIRRGLVNLATDWKWSSATFYAGLGDGPLRIDAHDEGWSL